jgi:class 3 adenylate cyclase/serine/threonine protein kinase
MSASRRLAAILAADIVGYSRLMGADEEGTLARLRSLRAAITDPKIAEHRGRIVKTTGDGLLAEFHSVVDALRCAAEIQTAIANMAQPADRRIQFRIGIHQGDVVFEDDGDIFGDGVNIAARLESIAEPGGICVSARVQEDASGRLPLSFLDMGEQALKNISRPVRAYRVRPAAPPGSPGEHTVVRTRPAAPTSGPLRPGTVLGHTYAIEQPIGRGSLGDVYRAKHVELGTTHAITLIQPTVAGDPKTAQLLVEEVRKLARVRHDAVVSYEGLFRDDQGVRYLVMEYVDGPSLAEVVAGRRLEPDEVLALRDRLAEGLAAAHARGIIHRDLSPDNVILADGDVGRAKLIGFGFAQTAEAGDATMIGVNLMARHAYASPEQLGQFGGRVDSRSDLYSLGLVLAAAAIGFGRTLDMGATPGQAILARQKKPDLSLVPAPLRPAISPLLEPRPEERPASIRDLLTAAAPPSDGAHGRKNRPAGWLLAAGTGVAAMLLAAATLFTLYRPGPSSSLSLEELRTQLAAATGGFACASIGYTLAPDRSVRVAGHIASPEDLMRLRREVAAIPGIGQPSYDVQLMGRPHCEMAALLTPFADPALRDGLSLAFAGKPSEVHLGERPSLEVRAPGFDSYIYIDYFDSGGDVLHLFPNERDRFNLRPWRNRFVLFKTPMWTVCGNVGRQLVTIIASATRLFPGPRPEVEDAKDYVATLGEALKKLPKDGAAGQLLFFDLREAPPWINPEAVCRS